MLPHVLASSFVIYLVSLSSLIPSMVAQDYSGTGYVIGVPKDRYYHEDVDDAVYNSKPYISGEKKPDTLSHSQVSPPDYDNSPDDDTKVTVVPRHVDIFSDSKEYNKEADVSSDGPHSPDIFGDSREDPKPSRPYPPEYNNKPDISSDDSRNIKPDVFGRKKPDIYNSQETSYPSLPYPPEYNKGPDVSKDVPQYINPFTSTRRKPDTYSRPQGNSHPTSTYPRDYDNFPDSREVGKIPHKPVIGGKQKPDVFRRSQEAPSSFLPYPPKYDKKEDDSSKRPQQRYNGQDYRQHNPSGFKYNAPDYSSTRLVKGAGKLLHDIVKDHVPALIKPLISPFFHDSRPKNPYASYEDGDKSYEDDEKEYSPYSADGYRKPSQKERPSLFKKGSNLFNPLHLISSFFPKSKKY